MNGSKASALQEPLLRAEQVAELLNVQPSTIYEWARMDYIPHIRFGTGKKKPPIRFEREEVVRWFEERKRGGRLTRIPSNNN